MNFIHDSSFDTDVKLGSDLKIWHFATSCLAAYGDNATRPNAMIGPNVR